jgi:hypothetical protein
MHKGHTSQIALSMTAAISAFFLSLLDITEFALRKSIVRALKIFQGWGGIGRFSEYMRFLANYVQSDDFCFFSSRKRRIKKTAFLLPLPSHKTHYVCLFIKEKKNTHNVCFMIPPNLHRPIRQPRQFRMSAVTRRPFAPSRSLS